MSLAAGTSRATRAAEMPAMLTSASSAAESIDCCERSLRLAAPTETFTGMPSKATCAFTRASSPSAAVTASRRISPRSKLRRSAPVPTRRWTGACRRAGPMSTATSPAIFPSCVPSEPGNSSFFSCTDAASGASTSTPKCARSAGSIALAVSVEPPSTRTAPSAAAVPRSSACTSGDSMRSANAGVLPLPRLASMSAMLLPTSRATSIARSRGMKGRTSAVGSASTRSEP